MAWIEVHQSLATHKKLDAAAESLRVSTATMAGHLIFLWLWGLDNAPDGSLKGTSNRLIAKAGQWTKNPDTFVSSLVATSWIDETNEGLFIHDWNDYAGKLIDQRNVNRARMRSARDKRTVREPFANRAETVREPFANRAETVREPFANRAETVRDMVSPSLPLGTSLPLSPTSPLSLSSPTPSVPHPAHSAHAREEDADDDNPDSWYGILWTLPNWKTERVHAEAWVEKTGVSETMALQIATELKAKWDGPSWKYHDPWATFQAWCRKELSYGINHSDSGKGQDKPEVIVYNDDGTKTINGRRIDVRAGDTV